MLKTLSWNRILSWNLTESQVVILFFNQEKYTLAKMRKDQKKFCILKQICWLATTNPLRNREYL